MTTARQIEAAFPNLPHDADTDAGWRNSQHSDCKIRCSEEVFLVHKAIVCRGPRASGFMVAACRGNYADSGEVNLSSVLPDSCHHLVPSILDFIYEGTFNCQPEALLGTFICADILQIRPLFEAALGAINEAVDSISESSNWKRCVGFWAETLILRGCHQVVESVANLMQTKLCLHFSEIVKSLGVETVASNLACLTAQQVYQLLDRDDLGASEDHVFDVLEQWQIKTDSKCTNAEDNPFAACRFAFLSDSRLARVATLESSLQLPPGIVTMNMVLHRIREKGGDEECDKYRATHAAAFPDGWLQLRRLKKRGVILKLRLPRENEVCLKVRISLQPDVIFTTSEASETTIGDLKRRLCQELRLEHEHIRIWDYFGEKKHKNLEEKLLETLCGCAVIDTNQILLEVADSHPLLAIGAGESEDVF